MTLAALIAEREGEFEKNRPQTDDKLLDSRKTSEDYLFGFKRMEGVNIYEVTDWGHIRTFLRESITAAYRLGLQEAQMLIGDLDCDRTTALKHLEEALAEQGV